MIPTTIDAYVDAVRRELRLPARAPELVELRAQLHELALGTTEADACAQLGDPAAYADALRGQPTDAGAPAADGAPTILGVPVTLAEDPRRSVRRLFDPTNPHIIVPKVMGIGWTINFGAVLVKLGLLRPDDVDTDVLSRVKLRDVALACLPAIALIGATTALSWWGLEHRDTVPLHWGSFGRADRWGTPAQGLVPAAVATGAVALVAAGAAAVLAARRHRGLALIAVGIATIVAWNGCAITLARVLPQGPNTGIVFVALLFVSFVAAPVLAWLPLRAALGRSWRATRKESR